MWTGTEWDEDSDGMVQSRNGTQWNWYTVWDWGRMGQELRGNGIQCVTGTQWDWYTVWDWGRMG